jgi:hypothetical protein
MSNLYRICLSEYHVLKSAGSIEEAKKWAKNAFPRQLARVTRMSTEMKRYTRLCQTCDSTPYTCSQERGMSA